MNDPITLTFIFGSLALPIYLILSSLRRAKLARDAMEIDPNKYREASRVLQIHSMLGGALAVDRLFLFTIVFWSRLPFAELEFTRILLLTVWCIKEIVLLAVWIKIK